jgi:hypothetical protein
MNNFAYTAKVKDVETLADGFTWQNPHIVTFQTD